MLFTQKWWVCSLEGEAPGIFAIPNRDLNDLSLFQSRLCAAGPPWPPSPPSQSWWLNKSYICRCSYRSMSTGDLKVGSCLCNEQLQWGHTNLNLVLDSVRASLLKAEQYTDRSEGDNEYPEKRWHGPQSLCEKPVLPVPLGRLSSWPGVMSESQWRGGSICHSCPGKPIS